MRAGARTHGRAAPARPSARVLSRERIRWATCLALGGARTGAVSAEGRRRALGHWSAGGARLARTAKRRRSACSRAISCPRPAAGVDFERRSAAGAQARRCPKLRSSGAVGRRRWRAFLLLVDWHGIRASRRGLENPLLSTVSRFRAPRCPQARLEAASVPARRGSATAAGGSGRAGYAAVGLRADRRGVGS